jgi:ABC-type amino acid transport substrate-binding protein
MSIDERGRLAVAELRDSIRLDGVRPSSDVVRASIHRRRRRGAGLVGVCAGLLLVGLVGSGRLAASPTPGPAATPTPTVSLGLACVTPGLSCAGGRIRVFDTALPVPVSFVPITGTNTDDITPSNNTVQISGTTGTHATGLTIFERPVPVDPRTSRMSPNLDGGSADVAAAWLSRLPFVASTILEPVTVGGYAGYRVDVALREGAELSDFKAGEPAAFTFVNGGTTGLDWTAAVSRSLSRSSYYLVDIPDHGLVVLWAWAWQGSAGDVAGLTPLVDSIRFR